MLPVNAQSGAEKIRRSYAAAGWRLWTNGTTYYAATTRSEWAPGCGQTLAAKTPVGCLQKVLAHPSMRQA